MWCDRCDTNKRKILTDRLAVCGECRRFVTFCKIAPYINSIYINSLTYLLTYVGWCRRAVQQSSGFNAVVHNSLFATPARQIHSSAATRATFTAAASRQTQLCFADRRRSWGWGTQLDGRPWYVCVTVLLGIVFWPLFSRNYCRMIEESLE